MRKQCLYERGLGWVYYDDEQIFIELRRERMRTCARMRRQKRCGCPKDKQWRCDGVCDGCRFQRLVDVSLNSAVGDSEDLMLEGSCFESVDQESMCVDKIYAEEKLKRLDEIMPFARDIGLMRLKGMSDREIAEHLGIARTTMYRMLEKAKKEIEGEFEEN